MAIDYLTKTITKTAIRRAVKLKIENLKLKVNHPEGQQPTANSQ